MAEDQITEATTQAAASITAKGAGTKAETLAAIMGVASGLSGDELNNFMASLNQIGHEADSIPDGAAAKNQASVAMKPSFAREAVEELFPGDAMSAEDKERISTVFEAAVGARVTLVQAELEEAMEAKLQEAMTEQLDAVAALVDDYVTSAARTWISENEVAVESTLRSEISESLVDSLVGVLRDHYVSIPEDRVDVVEELASKLDDLSDRYNQLYAVTSEQEEQILAYQAQTLVDEATKGMTVADAEKFRTLAEGLEFDGDLEQLESKLGVLKSQHFGEGKPSKALDMTTESVDEAVLIDAGLLTEAGEEEEVEESDPQMAAINRVISRMAKPMGAR